MVDAMRKVWIMVLLGLACLYGWRQCHAPIVRPPGVLVTTEPRQTDYTAAQPVIRKEGWTLKPLAGYTMEARVLGVARYSDGPDGKLSPYDIAVGWGPMSDTGVLDRISFRHSHRFYHWTYWGSPPIPEKEIISHSCNVHLIPANDGVLGKMRTLRTGSLIRLRGVLVEATHPQGSEPWRSSLSRTDTGKGACEIIYVQSLSVR